MKRAIIIACWLLQASVAALFLYAGSMKLMAEPHMVETFAKVGVGQWFRVLTGVLEVGGGIALLIPRLAAGSALMLAAVMVGATTAHLTVLDSSPALALVLLAACLAIAWLRRDNIRLRGAVTR